VLLCSCVKVCEAIELPFEVVSGVDQEVGVLDGVHIPQGEGRFGRFYRALFKWRFWLNWEQRNVPVFDSCVKS